MKKLTPEQREYWQRYLRSLPPSDRPENPRVSAAHAGSPVITDSLLGLYFQGKKYAGSSILEDFLSCGDAVPAVDDYWIFLDSQNQPRCILKTEKVELHKFYEVPEAIAVAEGEGDLSLEYWRRVHAELYEPQLAQWGVAKLEDTTVVTEFFTMVYRGDK